MVIMIPLFLLCPSPHLLSSPPFVLHPYLSSPGLSPALQNSQEPSGLSICLIHLFSLKILITGLAWENQPGCKQACNEAWPTWDGPTIPTNEGMCPVGGHASPLQVGLWVPGTLGFPVKCPSPLPRCLQASPPFHLLLGGQWVLLAGRGLGALCGLLAPLQHKKTRRMGRRLPCSAVKLQLGPMPGR